ncbi:MAG: DUF481 domain-containing protein [Chlorobi bacterium CHB2]|nr:DUF481 domain-containing protein [Chlorobi bacterium CHB2]
MIHTSQILHGWRRTAQMVAAVWLVLGTTQAQVNTESMRREWGGEGVHGQAGFNLALQQGNSQYLRLGLGARVDYLADPIYAFTVANWQRRTDAGILKQHDGFLHARVVYTLIPTVKAEGFAQKEFNDFIRLKDRDLLGAGVRFTLAEANTDTFLLTIHLGTGAMYEREVLDLDPTDHQSSLVRSTNYLSFAWRVRKNFSVTTTTYYQPAFGDPSDFRVLSNLGGTFSISDLLSFNVVLNYRYDHQPPPAVRPYDLSISNGVTVGF